MSLYFPDVFQDVLTYFAGSDRAEFAKDREQWQHEHAIERQLDLISYQYSEDAVELLPMDARQMNEGWTASFDAIMEKGALDAIYLSGDGNLEMTVQEFERILKPGGTLLSVSGVVPEDLRREVFSSWKWLRDGTDDLQAGCFVLERPAV